MGSDAGEEKDLENPGLLTTEYSEVGEAARYRHKLIHNSYYLLVIVFGVFIFPAINSLFNYEFAKFGLLTIGFGLITLFLSGVIHVNNLRRTAAYEYRNELSKNYEPLALQRQVNNLGAQKDDSNIYERESLSNIHNSYWSNILDRNVGEVSDIFAVIGAIALIVGLTCIVVGITRFI